MRGGGGEVDVEAGDGAPVDGVLHRPGCMAEPAQLVCIGVDGDKGREARKHADAQERTPGDRRELPGRLGR